MVSGSSVWASICLQGHPLDTWLPQQLKILKLEIVLNRNSNWKCIFMTLPGVQSKSLQPFFESSLCKIWTGAKISSPFPPIWTLTSPSQREGDCCFATALASILISSFIWSMTNEALIANVRFACWLDLYGYGMSNSFYSRTSEMWKFNY